MSVKNSSADHPRRILSIWLPTLAMDRWRLAQEKAGRALDAEPFVLIADTAHGLRIEAINRPAFERGARTGMMLADARALCPQIATAPSDPAGDGGFLEQLAVWTQRWGPYSAIDAPDGLLVDVTAIPHLFGGEANLLADVQQAFAQRKLASRAAIAPTAGAGWALAHYGPDRATIGYIEEIGDVLADFPIAAMRLDQDAVTVLRRLGLKQIGDLADIGRDAIQRRFRNRKSPAASPLIRLDQMLGRVAEPLLPVVSRHAPLVQRRLMEPIRHRSLLDTVVGDLAADMACELESRGEGARRLELHAWRVDGEVTIRCLEVAAATRDVDHMIRLFAAKLDDIDAGFGIEMLRLRASWTEPLSVEQHDIETKGERRGTSLATCIDRLTVRLGSKAISRPIPFASHVPERAQRWQPPLEPESDSQGEPVFNKRPLKLLDRPERIAVLYATPDGYPKRFRWRGMAHEVVRVEGPERIAPEWWRERGNARLRDYYRIEDKVGRRYWIYRLGIVDDGRGDKPDWYLQGLCA